MKRSTMWMSAAVLILCGSCNGGNTSPNQVKYQVEGVAPDSVATVYLTDQKSNSRVDSAAVTDGTFAFEGTAEKDALMGVVAKDGEWTELFFNDGTPVKINLADKSLKGSSLNERLTDYDVESSRLLNELTSTIERIMQAPEEEQEGMIPEYQEKLGAVADYYKEIFEKEQDNIIPVAFLGSYISMLDTDELEAVLDSTKAYMSHPIAVEKKEAVAMLLQRQKEEAEAANKIIGQKFIDLEEPDVNGKMHRLSEYAGKGTWVLVDFCSSWCGSCRAEMPNVVAANEKYHAKGFDIVGVSFDKNNDAWVKAGDELKITWTHLSYNNLQDVS